MNRDQSIRLAVDNAERLGKVEFLTEEQIRNKYQDQPRIYDVGIDMMRFATQFDIDNLLAVQRAYGQLRESSKKTHDDLMASIKRE